MKISGPVATGVIAAVVLCILVAGYFYTRHATGGDVADAVAESMKKQSGKPPISPEQIEAFKRAARERQTGTAR